MMSAPVPDQQMLGRRKASRLRLQMTGKLITRAETMTVKVVDLSATGARLRTSGRVAAGCDAVLTWPGYEAFGAVVWCGEYTCGMEFDEPVPREVLIQVRQTHREPDERALARNAAANWVRGYRATPD